MEQGVKLRLGLALLLAQLVVYYYVPRGSKSVEESAEQGNFCRVSPADKVCLAPITALLSLCPLPSVQFAQRAKTSKDGQLDDDEGDGEREAEIQKSNKEDSGRDESERRKEEKIKEANEIQNDLELSTAEEKRLKEEKQSSLIYQIIVVLLVVSVTASLADCFHERSRRKANPDAAQTTNSRGEPTLNRRMSLADLTMQRHARRESQASFRPPAGKTRLKTGPGGLYGAP